MKLKYYGTGAAEGIPAMFCSCDICEKSRAAAGRNIRTRSQAMVDDRLLIDFGPDTYLHVLHGGLPMKTAETLLITHNHADHVYPTNIEMRRVAFAHGEDMQPLHIYGTAGACGAFSPGVEKFRLSEDNRVYLHEIQPFHPFSAEGYTITPLRADHDPKADPIFYAIAKDGKQMLYAHDTGYFPEETWAYLEQEKPYFSLISLDCTGMTDESYYHNHMGLKTCGQVKERLEQIGAGDQNTRWIVNHFSHNGKATYDELVPLAQEKGFLVSYDGLEVEF